MKGSNLQICVVPMLSKQELNGDSNYVILSTLVPALLRRDPSLSFVVVWPDNKSGYSYEDDGFFHDRRIARAFVRVPPRKLANAMSFDAGWWDQFVRHAGFDVQWVNLVEVAAHVRNAGQGSYSEDGRPFLIAAHNYVIHDSLPYPIHSMQPLQHAQLMGALAADKNVFNSAHCESMFYDNAREWLSEKALTQLHATSMQIPLGTLESSLTPTEHENEIPIIIYNHRLQQYKNFSETFENLWMLWQEGLRFKVIYTSNTTENASKIQHYPFVEVHLCAKRAEYLATIRRGDLNVTNSFHETFCISAIESMALGQPLIAPAGVTFPEITGAAKGNGYPYLFKTHDEQMAMLRELLTNREKRQKWGAVISAHVRREYNTALWAERYLDLFKSKPYFFEGTPEDTRQMVRTVLRTNDGATTRELLNRVFGEKVNGRTPLSSQSLSATRFIRLARFLGGEFYLDGGAQRLKVPTGGLPSMPEASSVSRGSMVAESETATEAG